MLMILNKENLLDGAKLSLENAQELIEEGTLLFDNGRFSRAFTLFQLSIEETGKSSLIFESVLFDKYKTADQQKALFKEIKDHKSKTRVSQKIDIVLAIFFKDIEMKKGLINNAVKQSNEVDKINDYKNFSLYVTLEENRFKKPSEKISKTLAADFKFYAEIRHKGASQLYSALINDEEILKIFETINPDDLLDNPPVEIKELLSLIENN